MQAEINTYIKWEFYFHKQVSVQWIKWEIKESPSYTQYLDLVTQKEGKGYNNLFTDAVKMVLQFFNHLNSRKPVPVGLPKTATRRYYKNTIVIEGIFWQQGGGGRIKENIMGHFFINEEIL